MSDADNAMDISVASLAGADANVNKLLDHEMVMIIIGHRYFTETFPNDSRTRHRRRTEGVVPGECEPTPSPLPRELFRQNVFQGAHIFRILFSNTACENV